MKLPHFRRQHNDYRPTSRRQRLFIVVATVATVVVMWLMLLGRPGPAVKPIPGSQLGRCLPGQSNGCVGGKAEVLLLPAPSASGASVASH